MYLGGNRRCLPLNFALYKLSGLLRRGLNIRFSIN